LNHRDAFIEDVVDIGTGLGAAKLVEVGDGVVVRVGGVILRPVTLDYGAGVLFVIVRLQGIFYCRYTTEQCATSGRCGYREQGRFREGMREDRGRWERGEGIVHIGGKDISEAANSSRPSLEVG